MPINEVTAATVVGAAIVTALVLFLAVRDGGTTARGEAGAFLGALVLYGVFFAAFFRPSFLTGNYIAPSDSLDFGVADYLAPRELWTQAMWSGYPVAADPQSQTWYPLLHLFRWLGADWNTFLVSAYVFASASGFLFVRRLTRSTVAGVLGGFVCGFSGMMVECLGRFNQIHAFAWVPLALYGLQLIREGLHRPGAAVAALAIGLMWLAGHPQLPVYATYLGAAIVGGGLLVDRASKAVALDRVRWSGAAVALGLALAAVSLFPMIELGAFAHRTGSWDLYRSDALPPWELLTFVVPLAFGGFWTPSDAVPYVGETHSWGYVGLLPVALAIAAPVILSRHRREARLWLGLAAIEALLCLGAATPVGTLFYYVPGYSSFQTPLRHLFLVTLCLAAASGLAVAELTERRERRGTLVTAVTAATLLGAVGYAVLVWRMAPVRQLMAGAASYARWALVWPLALAGALVVLALAGRRFPRGRSGAIAFGVLLIAVEVTDLATFHGSRRERLQYADIRRTEAVLHPDMVALRTELERTGERVLASDGSRNQFLLPNLTRAWRMPVASGTGSLAIKRYLEMLDMETAGAVPPEILSSPAHHGADLFAVRYALVRQDSPLATDLARQTDRWFPVENLHYYEEDPDTHYTLFRNLRARPRAWCTSQVTQVSPYEVLQAVRTGQLAGGDFEPSRTTLIESGALPGWQQGRAGGAGEVIGDPARRTRYLVRADAPCVLVLSEVYYPWWRASLDGAPVDVLRVNHAMVGIVIPAGSHLVRLWFQPVSVWIGGAVSGIALLLCAALLVPARVRLRRVFFLRVQ